MFGNYYDNCIYALLASHSIMIMWTGNTSYISLGPLLRAYFSQNLRSRRILAGRVSRKSQYLRSSRILLLSSAGTVTRKSAEFRDVTIFTFFYLDTQESCKIFAVQRDSTLFYLDGLMIVGKSLQLEGYNILYRDSPTVCLTVYSIKHFVVTL